MFIINVAVLHQNKWKTYTQQFGMELSWYNTLCLNIDIFLYTKWLFAPTKNDVMYNKIISLSTKTTNTHFVCNT